MSHPRRFHILLVDDDPPDAFLTMIAIRESKFTSQVHHVDSGPAALSFLRRDLQKYALAPRPDLILLDLNMPVMTGHQVLTEIKSDDALKEIPVIVLSTSESPTEARDCYREGANTFISRPLEIENLFRAITCVEEYWFSVAFQPA